MTDLIAQNSYPAAPPPQAPSCAYCGCGPTVNATFRGHRGIIIVMQFLKQKGPFCRDCGISTFRTMTSRTLVQGWWGYASFIITPFILIWNLIQRLKLNKLGSSTPAADGNSGTPLPVGKPLYLRATIAGLLVPLSVIGFIGYALAFGGAESRIGQCIIGKAGEDVEFVSCDKPNDGKVISVADTEDACPAEATGFVEQYIQRKRGRETKLDGVLCIKE
ncbi:MAG TPA: hypothetical protein DGT23_30600 [Micromonosporaceae bacterium]|nr:hypothetical protein [Micromonosporaceae bacterium]